MRIVSMPDLSPTRPANGNEPGRSDLRSRLEADQRRRWQAGERVAVEAYLEQEPALRDDADAVLDLLFREVTLREERGEAPPLDELLRRFPQYDALVRLQFSLHRAFRASDAA